MMEISIFFIKTDRPAKPNAGGQLRGAIASLRREVVEFHNHLLTGGYRYSYPVIQYKIMNGVPSVVTIGNAADAVRGALEGLGALRMGKDIFKVDGVIEKKVDALLGPCKQKVTYEFLTPYIALNSKNLQLYRKYKVEKAWLYLQDLQQSILVGNVLSLCKGLKIVVEESLRAKCFFRETREFYRGINAVAFSGRFTLNYSIPDFLGVGRGVSEGWGTLMRVAEGDLVEGNSSEHGRPSAPAKWAFSD